MHIENASVLIVDDAATLRAFLRQIMSLLGVKKIHDAASGKRALQLIGESHYDVVFLDIELPDSNGCQILQAIKQRNASTHVVMCSSHSSVENVTDCLKNGASGFITKPFAPQKIVDVIRKCLSSRHIA